MEELVKFTLLTHGRTDYLTDRYSKRGERARKTIDRQIGKLQRLRTRRRRPAGTRPSRGGSP
jgi:hypothetical protein